MDIELILSYGLRLLAGAACGFVLGIERKSRQNAVGIRTLVLISLACSLLSILSIYIAEIFPSGRADPTRIASTTVTGIGFIGGGAILKNGLNIRGLTTAAIILMAAALGLSCGAGLYIPAFITLALALIILFIMNRLERIIFPATKTKKLILKINSSVISQEKIIQIIKQNGLIINDINMEFSPKEEQITLTFTVKTPYKLDAIKLSDELGKAENVINFTITD